MTQLMQPFDARTIEPSSFLPPPQLGDYHVQIVESEVKPTKDNTGGMIEFTLAILDPGPYLNQKVRYALQVYNQNQTTVEIAYRSLSALCHVTGQFNLSDTRQLHNIPFMAKIGPQAANPKYTEVFTVMDVNGNLPGKKAIGSAPVTQAAAPPQPNWNPAPTAAPVPQAGWQPQQLPPPSTPLTQAQPWMPGPTPVPAAPAPAVWQPTPTASAPNTAPPPPWQPNPGGTPPPPPWLK